METYIAQLIDDICKATHKLRPPHPLWPESEADPDNELELQDMSFIEQYVEGKVEPVASITGIEVAALPPPEKLTEAQQALLATKLEELLQFFHLYLDFPETYPAHLRYPFIRNFWTECHVPLSFGENHIEFCNYEIENCPYPGYCQTCAEIDQQMEFDKRFETKKNEFSDLEAGDLLPSPEEVKNWAKLQGSETDDDEDKGLFDDDEDYDPASDFVGGFFHDDGTPIDPETIPVPGLCIICKKYFMEDPDEKMLCLLNRIDQRDETGFECGAFEKL